MQAYFSFDLSTNYARLDVMGMNNGAQLRERLKFQCNNFGYSKRNDTV